MSSSAEILSIVLEWSAAKSIFIDERIHLGSDEHEKPAGIGVYNRGSFIPPNTTLVKIPKDAVLSVRNCSLAPFIAVVPYGLGAQLSLSIALFVEILQQERSKWNGYLRSLPERMVDIPLFWDVYCSGAEEPDNYEHSVDSSEALQWLTGTEAHKVLHTPSENGYNTSEEIRQFYYDIAEPLLLRHKSVWRNSTEQQPTLLGFHRAFSLVSSRAFLVDAYHGLSMVPVADAFNHVVENHVHLESDYNVCPECGSLEECPHDGDEDPRSVGSIASASDQFYEMVSNTGIAPHAEIFNTYGETLTNAQLLNQYGFILDLNSNDRLTWSLHEVVETVFPGGNIDIGQILPLGLEPDVLDLSQSELVYLETTNTTDTFCLNDEGNVSLDLWALLVHCIVRVSQQRPSPAGAVNFQLAKLCELQLTLESSSADDGVQGMDVDTDTDVDRELLDIVQGVARAVVLLCRTRKLNSGKPGSGDWDLSGVLEDVPEGRPRTRLAISVLMSERSILDACEAGWSALVDCIAAYGALPV